MVGTGGIVRSALLLACAYAASPPREVCAAEYFLSAQDGRAGLEDGAQTVRSAGDTLAVVELEGGRLRIAHEIALPTSLVGPPTSIALAPGGRIALVTAATRRSDEHADKVVPDDLVSVVVLDPSGREAPRVASQLRTGAGASGVSIDRTGTLALVANRVEGSVSVLRLDGDHARVVGRLALGEKSGPAHVAFTPDGRHALVTRDGDNRVSWLVVDGDGVRVEQDLFAGLRPYCLDVSPDGAWAVATNLGGGRGDVDTISLLDLSAGPPRVVDTVSVGQTPEAAFFSPDGRSIGVTVIDGSNKPRTSPFHGTARFRQLRIEKGRLREDAEIVRGAWLQGFAFSADGHSVLVQDARARKIVLYRRSPEGLVDANVQLGFEGAPGAIVRMP